jgi:valyl-tRNA synthetase
LKWEKDSLLAVAAWPKAPKADEAKAHEFEEIRNIVTEIRFINSVLHLRSGISLYHVGDPIVRAYGDLIKALTRLEGIKEVRDGHGLHLTTTSARCWLDIDQESTQAFLHQLKVKQEAQTKVVAQLEGRLANKSYVQNAPKAIVEQTKDQLAEAQGLLKKVTEEYDRFADTPS